MEHTDQKANTTQALVDLMQLGQEQLAAEAEYQQLCEDFWQSLSMEQQLQAFHSVVSRIHRGEIVDQGSYRHVLYEVFGFGPDSYYLGMLCGYMVLHNSIFTAEDLKRIQQRTVTEHVPGWNHLHKGSIEKEIDVLTRQLALMTAVPGYDPLDIDYFTEKLASLKSQLEQINVD